MGYQVTCRALGVDCDFIALGATIAELMEQRADHDRSEHGLTEEQIKNPARADLVRTAATNDERARLKELEREVFELRRANEILRKASAYFAQAELDRRAR